MGKYGKHTELVNDVIELAGSSNLLGPGADLANKNIVIEKDLEIARDRAWTQDEKYGSVVWSDLRELEMSKILEQRYELSDFGQVENELDKLLDRLGDNLIHILNEKYHDLVDDILADMYDIAYSRAVNGIVDNFFEKLFGAYKSGGWPCGWEGDYPEGKLVVFVP